MEKHMIKLKKLAGILTEAPLRVQTTDQRLVDAVIKQIEMDIKGGDTEALDELLKFLPKEALEGYLGHEQSDLYRGDPRNPKHMR
jgi:hypothetical protein